MVPQSFSINFLHHLSMDSNRELKIKFSITAGLLNISKNKRCILLRLSVLLNIRKHIAQDTMITIRDITVLKVWRQARHRSSCRSCQLVWRPLCRSHRLPQDNSNASSRSSRSHSEWQILHFYRLLVFPWCKINLQVSYWTSLSRLRRCMASVSSLELRPKNTSGETLRASREMRDGPRWSSLMKMENLQSPSSLKRRGLVEK